MSGITVATDLDLGALLLPLKEHGDQLGLAEFNANGWHYAFYAFREDTWDGMDYELGSSKLPWSYWQAKERGENPIIARNYKQPAFNAIISDIQK